MADLDPEKCECKGWTIAHLPANVWMSAQSDFRVVPLGHHPACRHWVKPPTEHVTGLRVSTDSLELQRAVIGLARAYQELYLRTDGRRVRVQQSPRHASGTIEWWEHEAAWKAYAGLNGYEQSAERVAARAGFDFEELTTLLGHEPTTWKLSP